MAKIEIPISAAEWPLLLKLIELEMATREFVELLHEKVGVRPTSLIQILFPEKGAAVAFEEKIRRVEDSLESVEMERLKLKKEMKEKNGD